MKTYTLTLIKLPINRILSKLGGHGNPSLMVDGATGERLDAKKISSEN